MELLGHSTIRMTAGTRGHVLPVAGAQRRERHRPRAGRSRGEAVDVPSAVATTATDINDRGQIIGAYVDDTGAFTASCSTTCLSLAGNSPRCGWLSCYDTHPHPAARAACK
jgi:hypothetical protein